jgi:hypothetical protein
MVMHGMPTEGRQVHESTQDVINISSSRAGSSIYSEGFEAGPIALL